MGIFQPGGVGTRIFLYDDASSTGRGAATGPHTPAQIAAFCVGTGAPQDFDLMNGVNSANTFSAFRLQYLQSVPVRVGGAAADGTNATSYLIQDCDVFVRSSAGISLLELRPSSEISPDQITITMGQKTGDRSTGNLGGIKGGTLHLNGTQVLYCNLGIYGSLIQTTSNFTIQNSVGASLQEFGGSLVQHDTAAVTPLFVLGTSDSVDNCFFENSTMTSRRTGSGGMISTLEATSLKGTMLCQSGREYFINSNSGRSVKFAKLSGTPTKADMRMVVGGIFDAVVVEPVWSGEAPLRVVCRSSIASPVGEWWLFDTKVVDVFGQPITGIPVYLESDIDGAVVSTTTLPDGNIVFNNPNADEDNAVLMREWFGSPNPAENTTEVRDRIFTLTVNGFKDPGIPPIPGYMTYQSVFEWPGRDRDIDGSYVVDAGGYRRLLTVIEIVPGNPTRDPIWTECDVA